MSLNQTPRGDRVHISLFGRRNAGKSSLINALTGQQIALVSEVPGTTTDPVYKAMEILPIGPVVIIDTAGLDDVGGLGELRIQKTIEVLNKTDVAIVVIDGSGSDYSFEKDLLQRIEAKKLPVILVLNKIDQLNLPGQKDILGQPDQPDQPDQRDQQDHRDLQGHNNQGYRGRQKQQNQKDQKDHQDQPNQLDQSDQRDQQNARDPRNHSSKKDVKIASLQAELGHEVIAVSAVQNIGIAEIKQALIKKLPEDKDESFLVRDIISAGDLVVLVTPIDSAAPKGRIILPQQQVLRDILDGGAIGVVTRETEFAAALASLGKKPKLVVTDSQAFAKVSAETPHDIGLTSFSILFARHKGDLAELVKGARTVDTLQDGDKILVAEGCTHHRQCDDIGTVKIPRWLRQYTGKQLVFEHSAGFSYPSNLDEYKLVVHCGACMLNRREMQHRILTAKGKTIPIVNYGVLIAHIQGILPRVLQPFAADLL